MGSAASVEQVEVSWGGMATEGMPNLQQVAAERLAAHRNKRATVAQGEAEHEASSRRLRESARQTHREDQRRGAEAVRDTVKARYERRESYREFLASEAERAIGQAQAEADVALRSARAVAEAQMQLLAEFDSANQPEPGPREAILARQAAATRDELAHALADIVLGARELMDEPTVPAATAAPSPLAAEPKPAPALEAPPLREISASGLTVRLFEDLPPSSFRRSASPSAMAAERGAAPRGYTRPFAAEPERQEALDALEEEIAFRHAPDFPEYVPVESAPIHGNLIEFPRELVAPRRARPRLADRAPGSETEPQLRIFEVDAAQDAAETEAVDGNSVPDWQSGMLESAMVEPLGSHWGSAWSVPAEAQSDLTLPAYTAPLERRLMSAAVDGALIAAGWMGAVAVAAAVAGPGLRTLSLPLLGAAAAGLLLLSAVLFQLLFFTLSGNTPGMRWARIGFCTFGDSNPTRGAMRARVLSNLLAACPLGLGLAWAFMDNDGLGWHDRMSRMYQRAY